MQCEQLYIPSRGIKINIMFVNMLPSELPEGAKDGCWVYVIDNFSKKRIGTVCRVSAKGWVHSAYPILFPRMTYRPITKWQRLPDKRKAALALINSFADNKA